MLCANFMGVRMYGALPGSNLGLDVLYWSSTAPGSYSDAVMGIWHSQSNSAHSWCGATVYASFMPWCDSVVLTTPPANCAAYGLAN